MALSIPLFGTHPKHRQPFPESFADLHPIFGGVHIFKKFTNFAKFLATAALAALAEVSSFSIRQHQWSAKTFSLTPEASLLI